MSVSLGVDELYTVAMYNDGVGLADVQAAIQAAWIADRDFAVELAKRYGLYDRVCLRCVSKPLAVVDPSKVCVAAYGARAYQMCLDCHYEASRSELLIHLLSTSGSR